MKDHTCKVKPSKVVDRYWLFATRKSGSYPRKTVRSGKWLIFDHISNIDQLWYQIKKATEQGKLGAKSKVATAKPNPNAEKEDIKVICVYTYDADDIKDVMQIREELRNIGISIL